MIKIVHKNYHLYKWFPNKYAIQYFCCCAAIKSCPALCHPMDCSPSGSLSFAISRSLLRFISFELVILSNCLILCHPLLLLPSTFPSIRVFSIELALHIKWPKYWSFNFSISSFNEYSRLISFSVGQFDLLKVQGTLKALLQHHGSKPSILWCTAFFMV